LIASEQLALRAAKITALISAIWTTVCALLLFSWEVAMWLKDGIWTNVTLAETIKDTDGPTGSTYVTASSTGAVAEVGRFQEGDSPGLGNVSRWIMDLPALPLLVVIAILLFLVFFRLSLIEKKRFHP
jgi:hypothetical protein